MTQKWWKEAIVYQVYPKSFYDSNNDGIGDLNGIIEKLDYLKSLGIDVIWVSPVYSSPMDDNGYDISDYYDIAPEFGTLNDMKNLIEEAEKRDMKIIMDLVINHTSDEHAWFTESKSSRTSSKRDWYIWQDAKEDGTPPNNLRSIFGGSCWEYDENTAQYYFHSFSKKQPDLNWENPSLRHALYEMVNWWLELGIGGFRVDAITFIKKPEIFHDVVPDGNDGMGIVKPNNPGIGVFLKELKEKTFDYYDVFTVAEAPGVSKEELPEFTGENGYFDMLIEFDHVDLDIGESGKWYQTLPWKVTDLKKAIKESQEIINHKGWSALYIENHDQPRSLNKFIPKEHRDVHSAKMLAITYFFLRGTPFIYQGQEIGMTNVHYSSIEEYNDLSTHDQYTAAIREGFSEKTAYELITSRSRDNARTPMQWSSKENGGFSTSSPWLKANENFVVTNVEAAGEDENSLWYFYKKLIELRNSSEYRYTFIYGKYEDVTALNNNIFAYKRVTDDQEMLIASNFSSEEVHLKVDKNVKRITGNFSDMQSKAEGILLRPFEAVVAEVH